MNILITCVNSFLLFYLIYRVVLQDTSELQKNIKYLLNEHFKSFEKKAEKQFQENRMELNQQFALLTNRIDKQFGLLTQFLQQNAGSDRKEIAQTLKDFSDHLSQNIHHLNDIQYKNFEQIQRQQQALVRTTEIKLEEMRETVDEKLHKTLEDRLGKSFKMVSERLESVQQGLGEMKTLANGVGDLKKVLSNVKTRGILGEIQLGNILEQIMSPEQYAVNVQTKKDSRNHVEFAVKLPGDRSNIYQQDFIYLPIDAKFPQESFMRLQEYYHHNDTHGVAHETKVLVRNIKSFARDIKEKYIDPPYTTDFGIMFLPTEGLYAEVVRQPNLITELQRDYQIIITGPTTLAALLNSLQVGFKTLAIQQRSSEVWQVLGAVKKQFIEFGKVLRKAQEKIRQADGEIEKLVTTRSNVMFNKLKNIEELPAYSQDSTISNNTISWNDLGVVDKENDTLDDYSNQQFDNNITTYNTDKFSNSKFRPLKR